MEEDERWRSELRFSMCGDTECDGVRSIRRGSLSEKFAEKRKHAAGPRGAAEKA